MRFNSTLIAVDPTPRRADGEYVAHARISSNRADGTSYEIHSSGDLADFDAREDASLCKELGAGLAGGALRLTDVSQTDAAGERSA
jgi:hypothetical protein